MITIFHDKIQSNAHDLFQRWREHNPSGFFVNKKGHTNSLLHSSSCPHLGSTDWRTSDTDGTLTDKQKICARQPSDLYEWANKFELSVRVCKHCKIDENAADILSPEDYHSTLEDILFHAESFPLSEEFKNLAPERVATTVLRIVRDTKVSRRVKELHEYKCQICGHFIRMADGTFYAEAHHIRPLGGFHKGPDVISNLLCVCPNCHVELDYRISPLSLEKIRCVPEHPIDEAHLKYHNNLALENTVEQGAAANP